MLYLLGALDADGAMTKLGRDMALFPLEPALSRMLLAAILHDCADDMVTVVAMLAADGTPRARVRLVRGEGRGVSD
jgi:ATP-dependent RNA helicase DHX8/PRP22